MEGLNGKSPRVGVKVGQFTLTDYDGSGQLFKLENSNGEAMGVPKYILESLLEAFWESNL